MKGMKKSRVSGESEKFTNELVELINKYMNQRDADLNVAIMSLLARHIGEISKHIIEKGHLDKVIEMAIKNIELGYEVTSTDKKTMH